MRHSACGVFASGVAVGFLALCLFACGLLACGSPQSEGRLNFEIDVVANSDVGPLADVVFSESNRDLGRTDATGRLHHVFQATLGQQLRVAATCPTGFVLETPLPRLSVFPLAAGRALALSVRCLPTSKTLVVLVNALLEHGSQRADPGANLGIVVDGVPQSATSDAGIAHVSVSGETGSMHRVQIITDTLPLRPASPERVFAIPQTSDFVVFEQRFETIVPPSAPTRRAHPRARPSPVTHAPVRIP